MTATNPNHTPPCIQKHTYNNLGNPDGAESPDLLFGLALVLRVEWEPRWLCIELYSSKLERVPESQGVEINIYK
jgi:hypothetical protein